MIKPIITSDTKGISQVKPRLGWGREGINKTTLKFPLSPPLHKPEQPKLLPGRILIIQIEK